VRSRPTSSIYESATEFPPCSYRTFIPWASRSPSILFEAKKYKKIKRKGTKLYHFACKTGSRIVKNTTQNAPKLIILRAKIKTFSGEGAPPPPHAPSSEEGDKLTTLSASLRRLWRLNPSAVAPTALELGARAGASFSPN